MLILFNKLESSSFFLFGPLLAVIIGKVKKGRAITPKGH